MPITRLNHAVLYVRDIDRSVSFYRDLLGFTVLKEMSRLGMAAFLRAPGSTNDHDLGLFGIGDQVADSAAGRSTVGLYHLGWEVDTLAELARLHDALSEAGALIGSTDHGTTKSLYAKDPDGIEFEVVWVVPAHKLDAGAVGRLSPLRLARDLEHFGAETPGGR
jgi:catechol-2,3-dioxygenase